MNPTAALPSLYTLRLCRTATGRKRSRSSIALAGTHKMSAGVVSHMGQDIVSVATDVSARSRQVMPIYVSGHIDGRKFRTMELSAST